MTMNKTRTTYNVASFRVDIEKLASMLSCGHATARKIGAGAHARVVIGRRE